MKVLELEQGSDEWLQARAGMITASKIKAIVAGNNTTSYKSVIADLVAERMSGKPVDGFSNGYMDRGNELEPDARKDYELQNFVQVNEVGFVIHPALDYAGCSPDGLVGSEGMVQIKCHKSHIHLNYIENGTVPKQYVRQMQWEMECTEREWSDFVSYAPQFPEPHNLWVKRIERDESLIKDILEEVKQANELINQTIKKLNKI